MDKLRRRWRWLLADLNERAEARAQLHYYRDVGLGTLTWMEYKAAKRRGEATIRAAYAAGRPGVSIPRECV